MPDQLSVQDFAAKVKAKYPAYKDIPDDALVDKVLSKYPQYKESVIITPKTTKTGADSGRFALGKSDISANPWWSRAARSVAGTFPAIGEAVGLGASAPAAVESGGVASAAGMAVGRAGGEAVRQEGMNLIRPAWMEAPSTGENLKSIGKEGAQGAVDAAVGEGTAAIGKMAMPPAASAAAPASDELGQNLHMGRRIMGDYAKVPNSSKAFNIDPEEEALRAVHGGAINGNNKAEVIKSFRDYHNSVGSYISDTVKSADQTPDIPVDGVRHILRDHQAIANPGELGGTVQWVQDHIGDKPLSPEELWDKSKLISRKINSFSEKAGDSSGKGMLQEIYSHLRDQLEARVPEVGPYSKTYAGVGRYVDALEKTAQNDLRKPLPESPLSSLGPESSKAGMIKSGVKALHPSQWSLESRIASEDTTPDMIKNVKGLKALPGRPVVKVKPWQKTLLPPPSAEGNVSDGPLFQGAGSPPKYMGIPEGGEAPYDNGPAWAQTEHTPQPLTPKADIEARQFQKRQADLGKQGASVPMNPSETPGTVPDWNRPSGPASPEEIAIKESAPGTGPVPTAKKTPSQMAAELEAKKESEKAANEASAKLHAGIIDFPGASEPQPTPKMVTNNASGESAASQEAINRAASEKAKGIVYYKVRAAPGSGTYEPVLMDSKAAVDYRPRGNEVIVKVGPDGVERYSWGEDSSFHKEKMPKNLPKLKKKGLAPPPSAQ